MITLLLLIAFGCAAVAKGVLRRRPNYVAMAAESGIPVKSFGISPPAPPLADEPGAGSGPFNVVITGGSKGVGAAMAAAFLSRGDSVLIAARSPQTLEGAAKDLAAYSTNGAALHSAACDIADAAAVSRMMAEASGRLGHIDLVVCNAGTNAYVYQPVADTAPEALEEVLRTNALGTLLTCQAAIKVMARQPGGGNIFVMKGAGSDGNPTRKYAAYGFSKAGMLQLAKSLSAECKDAARDQGNSPIGVHTLSPGLVFTELLDCGRDSFGKTGRFFVNTIAELPVDVAADVVPKLRAVAADAAGSARRAPLQVEFLTPDKLLRKLYNRLVKGENRDRFNPEDDTPTPVDRRVRLQWAPWLEGPTERLLAIFRKKTES